MTEHTTRKPEVQGAQPASRRVRVGLVQMACGTDRDGNLQRALAGIEDAAKLGARIVCLPELFLSRYFCQEEDPALFDLAETIPGPTTGVLGEVARKHGIAIVASLFERRAPGVYHNTAVVVDADGEIAGTYRKMHIPHDPLYFEKYYFTPGDTGFVSVPTRYARLGPMVCWDQWFPEAARIAALRGAEILVYPTAIGWHAAEKESLGERQLSAWMTAQRAHAIANGVFVVAANRVGVEGTVQFWGNSFVAAPSGIVLGAAEGPGEATVVVDCDLAEIEEVRRNWPFFRDRRVDAYGPLTARWLDEGGLPDEAGS